MQTLRRLLFWLHLCAAVAAGLVIVALSATGLLLAFESQILEWAERDVRHLEARSPALSTPTPPSIERLLAGLRAGRPELPVSAVTLRAEPDAAIALAQGREGVLFVDPARGAIVGAGAPRTRAFFRRVTELHRYLGASGERRDLGKATTGAANLAFVVILLSGLYIWLPRVFARSSFRQALWFRRGLPPKARDFNWHHVFGIWALVPLLLIVVSALPISYGWAGRLVMKITGSAAEAAPQKPPAPATPAAEPRPAERAPETPKLAELELAGLDRALAVAIAETPGWRSITLRLPMKADGTFVVVAERAPRRGRPDLRTQLSIAAADGAIASRESFATQSLGRRVRSWMRWIHTGEAGGWIGQAIGALACAAVLILGWTGYALAWRRYRSWRTRIAKASEAAVTPESNVVREPSRLLEE